MEPVTMLPKVVILLACLYVVRAGVFTINVYEDENNEIENVYDGAETLDRSVRSCVNSQCNSVCRRLGFARGVCISSTVCRCSGRLAKANDEDASLDNFNQEIESVYDGAETIDRAVRSCVNSQCNSVCRALGFARGVCISSTVCRCSGRKARDAFLDEANQEIDQDPEEVVVRTSRSCGAAECNTFCRKLGYARGVCIGTYCQCRARAASDVLRPEIENPSEGDDDARSAFLNAISPEIDNPTDEAMLESSVRKCVNSQCRSACRRRGFTRGVCVGINVCRCSGRVFRATEEAATLDDVSQETENVHDETLDRSVRSCVNSQCNSVCRRLGFARGVCISSTVCRCSGRLAKANDEDASLDNVNQETENVHDGGETLDRSVRSCVNSQCNSVCRRLGFARGVCISSTVCRCSGRLAKASDVDASLDNVNQETENVHDGGETLDRSVRSCVNSQCNSVCRRLGFARGVCISSTVCRCSGRLAKASDVDASLDNVNQEIENVYDGAETLDRSVRSCVNSQCNSVCRRLGFARGVCISSTVCRCSGRLAKASDVDASLDNVNQEIENVYDGAETLDRSVRSCVNSQCNSVCRRLGFARGVCISSTVCRCSGRLAKASDVDASLDNVNQEIENVYDGAETLDRSVRSCVNSQCNSVCRRLGFARGVCISSTVCRCSGRLAKATEEASNIEDVNQEIENFNDGVDTLDRSVRSCVNSQCNSVCRRLGFARGVCISSTVCRCSGRKAQDASPDANTTQDETPETNDVADKKQNCNQRWCEQTCRRMGFPGGACVKDRCKCDILRSSSMADSDDSADAGPGNVNPAYEEESNDILQN